MSEIALKVTAETGIDAGTGLNQGFSGTIGTPVESAAIGKVSIEHYRKPPTKEQVRSLILSGVMAADFDCNGENSGDRND
jgi:hypothetical protein